MALTQIAKIRFTSSKSCFISVPRSWSNFISKNVFVVEAVDEKDKFNGRGRRYLTWSGEYASEGYIEMNGLFGVKLDLKDGQEVIVSNQDTEPSPCKQCFLEPMSENDWEILSLNATAIESSLLNQIRVIWKSQSFPVWLPQGNVCLYVRVSKVTPDQGPVLLVEMSEVIVAPPGLGAKTETSDGQNQDEMADKMRDESITKPTNASLFNSVVGAVSSYLNPNSSKNKSEIEAEKPLMFENMSTIPVESKHRPLRVLPHHSLEDEQINPINTVFLNPYQYQLEGITKAVAKLWVILSPTDRKAKSNHALQEKHGKKPEDPKEENKAIFSETHFESTFVSVQPLKSCPFGSAIVCDLLRRQLGLSISSRIFVEKTDHEEVSKFDPLKQPSLTVTKKFPSSDTLKVHPVIMQTKVTEADVKSFIINYLEKEEHLVVSHGTLIDVKGVEFLVTSNGTPCIVLKSPTFSNIELGTVLVEKIKTTRGFCLPFKGVAEIDKKVNLKNSNTTNPIVGGFDDVLLKLNGFTKSCLNFDPLSMQTNCRSSYKGTLLLCGPKGSGKSFILNAVTNNLVNPPHFVYVKHIDCKLLRGKRVESLQKVWMKDFCEANYRQPAVLVFHNLDILTPAPTSPEEQAGNEVLYYYRVALLFITITKLLENSDLLFGNRVLIIATAKSKQSLHQSLVQSKSSRVFEETIELRAPDLTERTEIISALLRNKCSVDDNCLKKLDLKDISRKTEGYLPLDLSALVEKTVHRNVVKSKSSKRKRSEKIILNEDDFIEALADFSPLSLRGVDLQIKSQKGWKDVGGLSDVKKTLLETLLWPVKYPTLFAKCPLRPQSCIILYGAPGTGKTLLAEALANECGMNFISVKGPELLSKYIGASEQAVRQLFSRAQSAKPCILFFDEFDSIAPRRGHDSTGVTDRVVNQLLTQMDGVEALQRGVYVLAATSRPDLLDPALLRPGRFDKCLHCSLPDESARKEIIAALSLRLSFESEVDLDLVAASTEDFSGADLQALLYSAQIDALHESLGNRGQEEGQELGSSLSQETEGTQIYCMDCIETGFRDESLCEYVRKELKSEVNVIKGNVLHGEGEGSSEGATLGGHLKRCENTSILGKIGPRHLMKALRDMKPSVNESSRRKYWALYDSFGNNRGNEALPSPSPSQGMGQKTTLA